ncbi:nitrate ABC transporter ATP-binding protein [Natronococcus pandeyae]|uniref:Nitrate ABC transporter ATP-binding protein n=1 Tax=Natronococcus pandeyae TaxID=2055836 RepID=A0A8J8TTE7_9EURY|nr:ABC transporter ATP-binding protein [Natronococcus pandeyae]TYL40135.1 nitrate ABC transporter ATP-binding protein [Natronococcus pandeyae]
MIELEGVTVEFDDVTAIADVDLRIETGEFVTVVGPSGCGKTTLLRTIGGLQEPTGGRVHIRDRAPERAQTAGDVGFVFQRHTLFPWKSALENVTFLRSLAGREPNEADAQALLRSMGLEGFENARPDALSGGMKQRVAIARALHLGADVLLMDEPFGELDEITRDELGVEIRQLWRRERKTVVFVTHSVPEAVFLADRCLVMRGLPGRIDATFDVDLPEPRDEAVFGTRSFQEQVARVRRTLHESYD